MSGAGYAGKPRPAVILQSDTYRDLGSITVSLFTTNEVDASDFRIPVQPTGGNGLTTPSWLMADKLMTVPRSKLGRKSGVLSDDDMAALNRAIIVFLGIG